MDRLPPDQPLTVTRHTEPRPWNMQAYDWRVPFTYDQLNHHLSIGTPGDVHGNLGQQRRDYDGLIGLDRPEFKDEYKYTPGMSWLENRPHPDIHAQVRQELVKHYPEAAKNFDPHYERFDDDDWGDDDPNDPPLNSRYDQDNDSGYLLGSWKASFLAATKLAFFSDEHRANNPPSVEFHTDPSQSLGHHMPMIDDQQHDRPFVYNGIEHKVYVGGPGDYHDDVYQHLWDKDKITARHYMDAYNDLDSPTPWSAATTMHGLGRILDDGRLRWYVKPDFAHEQVGQALGKLFGIQHLVVDLGLGDWTLKTAGEWSDYENEINNPNPPLRPKAELIQHTPRITEVKPVAPYEMPNHEWRRPIVYDKDEDHLYVGQPSMEHGDMFRQMNRESPWDWSAGHPSQWRTIPGYIDTGNEHGGGLNFFTNSEEVPNVEHFHDWAEKSLGVPRTAPPNFSERDWISSHLRQATTYDNHWLREREVIDAADEAEREDWEANPNPHKWSGPGTPGKAFMTTETWETMPELHTWNNRGPGSNYWMHGNQARMREVTNDYGTHIYMNEDGQVKNNEGISKQNPELARAMYEQLKAHHPGVTWPALDETSEAPDEWNNEDWTTSKISWREQYRLERENRDKADEAEELDWEANPTPMKWKGPGVEGKAFLDTDGQVHTWDEQKDSDSRYWMHGSQARLRGVQMDPYTHIYLDPNGTVRDDYNIGRDYPEKSREMFNQLKQHYPTLTWPEVEGAKQIHQAPNEFEHEDWS